MARAARSWAVEKPAGWALLYGSPVPGYHAPSDKTVEPGTRVVGALFTVVAAGVAVGDIEPSKLAVPQVLSSDLDRLRTEFSFAADDAVVAKCLVVWAALVGAISLEVFNLYGADTFTEPALVFDTQVRLLVDMLGQKPH
jgi:hypothetical protein